VYGHLSQVSTVCGSNVEKGKLIGLSGDTGNSFGPHLHFEVRVLGGYLNFEGLTLTLSDRGLTVEPVLMPQPAQHPFGSAR
jgi:murein DD-endopeptidase MepM/ murein hydrolase activator NlpD